MQPPIHDTLRLMVRGLDGSLTEAGDGQRVASDLDTAWVDVRQMLRHKDSYPSGFRLDKHPGDYTLTRFHEGSWSYITRFYARDGTWKGDYASLTTPIAIFSDQLRLMDLQVSVRHGPRHPLELTGLETLRSLQQKGVISALLVQKVQEETTALLQQFAQQGASLPLPQEAKPQTE
jgi:hypothetical protein